MSDFWEVESYYHYRQLFFCPDNNFWLRHIAFDIACILGEREVWHASEYLTWNCEFAMGENRHNKFCNWLEFVQHIYGKQIPEFKHEEWMPEKSLNENRTDSYKEEAPIYHDTFEDSC